MKYNNRIMPDEVEFEKFVMVMMQAAETENLPIMLEHSNPMDITMRDIQEFSNRFKQETGLAIEFNQYTCDDCGRLHFHIIVDYPDDEYEEDEDDYGDQPGLHMLQ